MFIMDIPTTRMAEMYMIMHGFKNFFYPNNPIVNDSSCGSDPTSDEEIFETAKEIFNQLVSVEYPVNLEEEKRSLKEKWLRIINDKKPVKENLFDGFIQAFGKVLEKTFPLPDSDTQASGSSASSVVSRASSGRTRAEKFALINFARLACSRHRIPSVEDHLNSTRDESSEAFGKIFSKLLNKKNAKP